MAGFVTSIAHNVYPAEFAQISQNLINQQAQVSLAAARHQLQSSITRRRSAIEGDDIRAGADREPDGHDWGPPRRRKRPAGPPSHVFERLAGEGALFEIRW